MHSVKRVFIGAALLLSAAAAYGSNFRAADQVYMPAIARVPITGAVFKTDVVISNVSNQAVQVHMAAVRGEGGNAAATTPSQLRDVGVIQPGQRLGIIDLVQTVLGESNWGPGQAIFFACRVGGNCNNCDVSPADCLPITVQGRIYAEKTGSFCPGNAAVCTEGQLFSGIPFYNYVSRSGQADSLDRVQIVGIRSTGTRVSNNPGASTGFRTNLGFVNASNTRSIQLRVQLFSNAGTLVATNNSVDLGPLGHNQNSLQTFFPQANLANFRGYVIVDIVSSTKIDPNIPELESFEGFFAYGSVLDNVTDDPTTLEAQYLVPMDYASVYPQPGKPNGARAIRR